MTVQIILGPSLHMEKDPWFFFHTLAGDVNALF